jgi:hypothetical protein
MDSFIKVLLAPPVSQNPQQIPAVFHGVVMSSASVGCGEQERPSEKNTKAVDRAEAEKGLDLSDTSAP